MLLPASEKTPAGRVSASGEHEQVVLLQLDGRGRNTPALQVARARIERVREFADAPRRQAGFLQITYAYGQIEALLNDVDDTVGEIRIHADLCMALEKIADPSIHRHEAEFDTTGEPQHAARLSMNPLRELFQFLDRAEDAHGPLEDLPAGLGEAEGPGRAFEQTNAQLLLQLGNDARQTRLNHRLARGLLVERTDPSLVRVQRDGL